MKFKDFRHRYHHDVSKLLTTHLAMAVFSILCSSPFLLELSMSDASKNFLLSVVVIFSFAFYYYLVRLQMWQLGAKDRLAAAAGRMTLRPLTGLWLGLLASAPSFLLNIVYLVSYTYQDYAAFQKLHSVCALLEVLWDAPAIGLRLLSGSPLSYLTVSVLPALFAGIGYYFGTIEFSLFPKKKR